MTRTIFLNRYFFPDSSATSQILSDLAMHLAASGHDVHVITSQQLYENPQARLPADEIMSGVHIHRIPTTQFGRSALLGRGVDYLSFYASAWRALRALVEPGDVIVAKTDPPLVSIVAMHVAGQRGAKLVNWLQDIYPEVAVRLGVPFLKGPVARLLSHLRDRCLRMAAANVVVGRRMGEHVAACGAAPDRIHVIANWTDDDDVYPVDHAGNRLRKEWGLEGKFVVGYSGNLGRAHEFETVLAAAERLKDHPSIVFLCVGGGHRFAELARRGYERGVDRNFRFIPYQDRRLLRLSLCAADVHWISLKPELEGLIVPSKFYGIAAAGRPVIAIAARDGEIPRLVAEYECGLVIEPGDAPALAQALMGLSADPETCAAMGRRARTMLEAHFSRRQALERWRNVLEGVASAPVQRPA